MIYNVTRTDGENAVPQQCFILEVFADNDDMEKYTIIPQSINDDNLPGIAFAKAKDFIPTDADPTFQNLSELVKYFKSRIASPLGIQLKLHDEDEDEDEEVQDANPDFPEDEAGMNVNPLSKEARPASVAGGRSSSFLDSLEFNTEEEVHEVVKRFVVDPAFQKSHKAHLVSKAPGRPVISVHTGRGNCAGDPKRQGLAFRKGDRLSVLEFKLPLRAWARLDTGSEGWVPVQFLSPPPQLLMQQMQQQQRGRAHTSLSSGSRPHAAALHPGANQASAAPQRRRSSTETMSTGIRDASASRPLPPPPGMGNVGGGPAAAAAAGAAGRQRQAAGRTPGSPGQLRANQALPRNSPGMQKKVPGTNAPLKPRRSSGRGMVPVICNWPASSGNGVCLTPPWMDGVHCKKHTCAGTGCYAGTSSKVAMCSACQAGKGPSRAKPIKAPK